MGHDSEQQNLQNQRSCHRLRLINTTIFFGGLINCSSPENDEMFLSWEEFGVRGESVDLQ